VRSSDDLRRTLRRIDRRGYKAYRDLRGIYELGPLELHVDHVQGDPFAAPSRVRLRTPAAGIPPDLYAGRVRRVALADFLARRVADAIARHVGGGRGSGRSGQVSIDAGGQEVLERSAIAIGPDWIEARIEVGLPAAGRTVLGGEAEALLCRELPRVAETALHGSALPLDEARRFVECVENQEHLRGRLEDLGLVAFAADGSILPRESGASDRPLGARAVPLSAPDALAVEIEVPNPAELGGQTRRRLRGLGVPRGVTLIVGGGYHGKSTLLRALERGVYPHVPGDGREYVVTLRDAAKVRAEDGRRVEQVDIHPFVADLPQGRRTDAFSSDDASGSTSQAANLVEALEVGTSLLLFDEDTSATNFMVRDARMQALVTREREPITAFVDRVRELFEQLGVSTVLVMGGCGDYLDVADTVILMDAFEPRDASDRARQVAEQVPTARRCERAGPLRPPTERIPLPESLDPSRGGRGVRIDVRGREEIRFGSEPIDLRLVEQLVDASQTRAVGHALYLARERWMDGRRTLREILAELEAFLDAAGLDALDPRGGEGHPGRYARPRAAEVAAALNRLRTLRVRLRRPPGYLPQGNNPRPAG
jgi:predicted ABC-class ATPase